MLAWILATARCLSVSVCLSVTRRCSIETGGRIELGFGMEVYDLFNSVFGEIRVSTKIRALFSGTLS